jgi:PadR family transcriptional regulator PadR
MRSWVTQLRKGVVELAVLGALKEGEAYGYQLLQRINRIDGLGLTESTVYPMLARLAREGTLEVRAVASPSGPPRRYYRLTAAGRRRLGEMIGHWRDVQAGLDGLLGGSES